MGASPSQLLPGSRPGPGARNRTPWGRCLGQAAHTGPRFRAWHKQLSLDAIRTSPRGRHSLHHPAYRRNYSAASTEKKRKLHSIPVTLAAAPFQNPVRTLASRSAAAMRRGGGRRLPEQGRATVMPGYSQEYPTFLRKN